MAKRNEGQVTVDVLLWKYSSNKAGQHPVKLRVTHQRKREYYPVFGADKKKLFLSAADEAILTTDPRKLRGVRRVLRDILDSAVSTAKAKVGEATSGGKEPFSFAEFERRFLGEESGGAFLHFFDNHIKAIVARQAGTARVYGSVASSFRRFLGKDIDPGEITPELLQRYEDTLRSQGNSDTWISICMRAIRSIYNRMAVNDDYLKTRYPFSRSDYDPRYKIPLSSGQKGLTMGKDETALFIHGKIPGEIAPENPHYRAKLLFLFSFFGQGLNFKDIALLRGSNVKGNVIEFERAKTIRTRRAATVVSIPITSQLREILEAIGQTEKNEYIFGVFDSTQRYTEKQIDDKVRQFVKTTNLWLERYCEHNNLPVVTTYAARHTFASLAKVHLPLAQISRMLGHSKIQTTEAYLGRFQESENRTGLLKVFSDIKPPKKKSK